MERVENGEVALPGDAEGEVGPVDDELVDEQLPAGAACHSSKGSSTKTV